GRRTRGGLAQRPPPGGDPYGHAPRTHPEPLCPDGGPRPLLTSLHSPPQSATPGHPREDPMTDLPGDPTQRLTDPTRERHPTPTGPAWERHFTLTGPARERHFTPTGSTCERHPTPTGLTRERHATPTSPSDQPSASADTPTTQRTPSLTSGSMEHPASPSHPARTAPRRTSPPHHPADAVPDLRQHGAPGLAVPSRAAAPGPGKRGSHSRSCLTALVRVGAPRVGGC